MGNQTVQAELSNTVFEVLENSKNTCGLTYFDRSSTMSKLGQVYLEIHELGYERVREIEEFINLICNNDYCDMDIYDLENLVIDKFKIHRDTAIILMSEAKDYKHSRLLLRERYDY